MATVYTVQAKLDGTAAGLAAAGKQAETALGRVKAAAEEASASGGGLESAFKHAGANITGSIGTVVSAIAKIGTAAVAAGALAGGALAFTALKSGLSRLETIQDATVSLTRMMGSAADAATLTSAALQVVTGTPFALPDFDQSARQLYAYGVQAQKIPGMLQAIADSAAASGQGTAAVSGLSSAFADMAVEGKVNLQTLQEFGTAGVNGIGILANHFGLTTQAMEHMISFGFVPSGEAMDALVSGIETGSHGIAGNFNAISGAAQELGQTVSGSFGNLKTAVARAGASMLTPFQSQIPGVINNALIPALDNAGKVLKKLTSAFADSNALQVFEKDVQHITQDFEPFVRATLQVVQQLSPLALIFKALQGAADNAETPLADMGKMLLQQFVPALSQLGTAVAPVVPALASIADALMKGVMAVMPGVITMVQVAVGVFQAMAAVLQALPAPLQALVVGLLALSKFAGLSNVLKLVAGTLGMVGVSAKEAGDQTAAAGAQAETAGGKFKLFASTALGIGTIAVVAAQVGDALHTAIQDGTENMGKLTNAILVNKDGLGGWNDAVKRASAGFGTFEGYMEQLEGSGKQVKANIDAASNGFVQFATQIPIWGAQFKGSLGEFASGLTQLSQTNLPAAQKAFRSWADSNNLSLGELNKGLNTTAMSSFKDQLTQEANQAGVSASKNNLLALAMGQAGIATGGAKAKIQAFFDAANSAGTAVDRLANKITALGQSQVSADTASIAFQQAVSDASSTLQHQKDVYTETNGSLDGFVASLDTGTQAGRDNKAALDQVAISAEQNAAAILHNKGSQDQANQAVADGRTQLINMLAQFGITGQAADDYANKLGLIKTDVGTNLHTNAKEAAGDVVYFKNQLDSINSTKYINIKVQTSGMGAQGTFGITNADGGSVGPKAYADGGTMAADNGLGLGPGMYKGSGRGQLVRFAEGETNWETWISGRFGQERRNTDLWLDAGARLGALQKLMGSGNSSTYNLNVQQSTVDPQQSLDAMLQALRFQTA